MVLALVHSRALRGLEAPAVTVEVHLANGLPSFTLVGLADTEVKESRERVRAALQTSGLEFPHNKRVTVSLAPADLPKESGRFDLPIALGILAAAGQIDAARLDEFEFAGELSLGGELRPVHGALAMGLALRRAVVPGRSIAGPSRRALPRRAARISACRARSAARAAGKRSHRRLAAGAPGRVPGPVPARGGDESLPLRPPGRPGPGLPLHARCRASLPRPHQRPAARPDRPAGRGAGGQRLTARRHRRRRAERGSRQA